MKDSPKERIEKLTNGILSRIEKSKKRLNNKEVTNQDVQLLMAQYSLEHISTVDSEKIDSIHTMLAKLDEQHMDIINLYWWGNKTYSQIAEIYGRPNDRKWVYRKLKEAYDIMRDTKD